MAVFSMVQFRVTSIPEYLINAVSTGREPGTCQTALVSPGAGWGSLVQTVESLKGLFE